MGSLQKIKSFGEKYPAVVVICVLASPLIIIFLSLHLLLWLEPKKIYKIQGELTQIKLVKTATFHIYDFCNNEFIIKEKSTCPHVVKRGGSTSTKIYYTIEPTLPHNNKDYVLLLMKLKDMSVADNDWNSWDRKKLLIPEPNNTLSFIGPFPGYDDE